jgi:hypothetical protein
LTKTGNGISEMKKIDETDNYKYLGVYLSRNLKYLKENLENKLNGMVRIIDIFCRFVLLLCSKLRCASDDGSHMEQPCAIHGRITEVHKAFRIIPY